MKFIPFKVVFKNTIRFGPPTYQKAITKTLCEYIDVFMKIFLNDFIIFNDISTPIK
jgi:hypothetical protein